MAYSPVYQTTPHFHNQTGYNNITMTYRTLIADDEMLLLNTVRTYLEQERYAVQTVVPPSSPSVIFNFFNRMAHELAQTGESRRQPIGDDVTHELLRP